MRWLIFEKSCWEKKNPQTSKMAADTGGSREECSIESSQRFDPFLLDARDFMKEKEQTARSELVRPRCIFKLSKRCAPTAKPWSHHDFVGRLKTFSPINWPYKRVSPIECAMRGWVIYGMNRITCITCKGRIYGGIMDTKYTDLYEQWVQKLRSNLQERHELCCPWRVNPTRLEFEYIFDPGKVPQLGFIRRLKKFSQVNMLPELSEEFLESISEDTETINSISSRLESVPEERVALILALCGWEVKSADVLCCGICLRDVFIRTFGQTVSRASTPSQSGADDSYQNNLTDSDLATDISTSVLEPNTSVNEESVGDVGERNGDCDIGHLVAQLELNGKVAGDTEKISEEIVVNSDTAEMEVQSESNEDNLGAKTVDTIEMKDSLACSEKDSPSAGVVREDLKIDPKSEERDEAADVMDTDMTEENTCKQADSDSNATDLEQKLRPEVGEGTKIKSDAMDAVSNEEVNSPSNKKGHQGEDKDISVEPDKNGISLDKNDENVTAEGDSTSDIPSEEVKKNEIPAEGDEKNAIPAEDDDKKGISIDEGLPAEEKSLPNSNCKNEAVQLEVDANVNTTTSELGEEKCSETGISEAEPSEEAPKNEKNDDTIFVAPKIECHESDVHSEADTVENTFLADDMEAETSSVVAPSTEPNSPNTSFLIPPDPNAASKKRRRSTSIIQMKKFRPSSFHPLNSHRFWCPWAAPNDIVKHMSNTKLPGWKLYMSNINNNLIRSPDTIRLCHSSTYSTAEDGLRRIRRVLGKCL